MYNPERSEGSTEPRGILNHVVTDKTVTNMLRSLCKSIVFCLGQKTLQLGTL